MSELLNQTRSQASFRHKLLATTSALSILCIHSAAAAGDHDKPTVWIELGGQMERAQGGLEDFAPPFFSLAAPDNLSVLEEGQQHSFRSFGAEGKLTFTPSGSDWVFSAAIRYGRSNSNKKLHYQKSPPPFTITFYPSQHSYQTLKRPIMGDTQGTSRESHAIVDFQVGKDVGLGLFGGHDSSVISGGVRFAQFTSRMDTTIHARPIYTVDFLTNPGKYKHFPGNRLRQTYTAVIHSTNSVHAIGPSLSWDSSLPVLGSQSDMTLNVDWGVNAALLFGRQKARSRHQTTGTHYLRSVPGIFRTTIHTSHYVNAPPDRNHSRTLAIPNLGGLAGLSLKFPNAKVSLGYRADFFFGAIDEGIDATKRQTVSFHGPFATIRIGLGG